MSGGNFFYYRVIKIDKLVIRIEIPRTRDLEKFRKFGGGFRIEGSG